MNITVNGEKKVIDERSTIAAILETLGYAGRKMAVALNTTFVPRDQYSTTILKEADEIEIVAPQQGG